MMNHTVIVTIPLRFCLAEPYSPPKKVYPILEYYSYLAIREINRNYEKYQGVTLITLF
ncbi:hypothetical protein LG003_04435 [Photorhabdus kleinii]|uniref:hypothetical protein n=1 Tax=Photorhabdus kleinii TaxID=768034 RepID=UPI0021D4FAD2|nr:hypothetical protein [Photorhabdus kleinii]MCT8342148.1 hypothetical protein [Photorhabdus kleinii]